MSKLNPHLKKLMQTARRVSEAEQQEMSAPPRFAGEVLRKLAAVSAAPQPSLLEFMALRGAALAGMLGLAILTLQLSLGASSLGVFRYAAVPCAEVLRSYLP